jgi:Alginate export
MQLEFHHGLLIRSAILATILLSSAPHPVSAQGNAGQPITIGDVTVSSSVRTRAYAWSWFGDDADGEYFYPAALVRAGVSRSKKAYDWQVELALPVILSLPGNAVKTGARGQLGLGATYFAANDGKTNAAALFVKQAAVRFNRLAGVEGQSIKVGRLEFNDGAEVAPKHDTLSALKRDRIAQRLLGTFAFSDVGRSVDGALYTLDRPALNVTALAGRPTQGVFHVDGWGELNTNIFYAALTGQLKREANAGEWRVFALGYHDYRDPVVKTDNRPLSIRSADNQSIALGTYGGHYLNVSATPIGAVDVLAWGVLQGGSWGTLRHRAGAFALEAGWQPRGLEPLKPWLRGGYNYGSGDADPNDQIHGTFFQVLPTPRIYARLPFFNMMNNADAFVETILRPATSIAVRADVHVLRLSNQDDLWYSGGGAFQPATFGVTGRPANGHTGLATLYDVSADYRATAHVALGLYYGYAAGMPVTRAIYATGDDAHFGYVEMLLRF